MRIVIAVGGNALLRRGDPMTTEVQRRNIAIAAGGGGIPTMYPSSGPGALAGVEAVIDKDLASELLAENVDADLFLMATDVDGVYLDWDSPEQRRLGRVKPEELAGYEFAAGSMGPKSRPRSVSRPRLAGGRRSARWLTSPGSWRGRPAPALSRRVPLRETHLVPMRPGTRRTRDRTDGNTSATPGRKMSSSRTRPAAAAQVRRNRPEELR